MRRQDREITDREEQLQIIRSAGVLRLALCDGEFPYIVPMHYGFEEKDGKLCFYLHSAKEGHKIDLIGSGAPACIELEGPTELISGGDVPCKWGAAFSSVICRGHIAPVTDPIEKCHGLQQLMLHQSGRSFVITEAMASAVTVLRFDASEITAKARKA